LENLNRKKMRLWSPQKYTLLLVIAFLIIAITEYCFKRLYAHTIPLSEILKQSSFCVLLIVLTCIHSSEDIYIPINAPRDILPKKRLAILRKIMICVDTMLVILNFSYQIYSLVTTPKAITISTATLALYSYYFSLIAVGLSEAIFFVADVPRSQRTELILKQVFMTGLTIFATHYMKYEVFLIQAAIILLLANLNGLRYYSILQINPFRTTDNRPLTIKAISQTFDVFFKSIKKNEETNNIVLGGMILLSPIALYFFPWWGYVLLFFLYAWVLSICMMFCNRLHIIFMAQRVGENILEHFDTKGREYRLIYETYNSLSYQYKKKKNNEDPFLFYTYLYGLLPGYVSGVKKTIMPSPIFFPVDQPQRTSTIPEVIKNMVKNPVAPQHSAAYTQHKLSIMSLQKNNSKLIQLIYQEDIDHIITELSIGLSVLIKCDKIISNYLMQAIREKSQLPSEILDIDQLDNAVSNNLNTEQLKKLIKTSSTPDNQDTILMIPHLDLLAGGHSSYLADGGRDLTQLLYRNSERPLLAFTDITFDIPEILSSRFSTTKVISGIKKEINIDGIPQLAVNCIIPDEEANVFSDFDPEELYRVISGMNPIKIRQAITYAINEYKGNGSITMEQLKDAIQVFKERASSSFVMPRVGFDQIGGYAEVKNELIEAINLIKGTADSIDEDIRAELIPRGFLFWGPPGTGKTLFAKAVAKELKANVMVVSGPETIDKYVGESERKIREIFAEARRNAPSVLVFDEFDSIATNRSNQSDGGARVGNGMVAQILTEMDGFRQEVPVLVIGTTNRLDIIDPALLRPSRFKPVNIGLPNLEALKEIIRIHSRKYKITLSDQIVNTVAESTKGFNGDEIQSVFKRISIDLLNKKITPVDIPERIGQIVGEMMLTKEKQNASVIKRIM
jgi:transitional endoplasmic reticulum ATPase